MTMTTLGLEELKRKLQQSKGDASMATGTICVLKPKAVFPPGLLTAILKTGVSEFSYAAATGETVEAQTFDCAVGKDGKVIDVPDLIGNLRQPDNYLDDLVIMHFTHSQEAVHEQDHQPFEVIKDKTGDLIMAFAEGDFPDYQDPDAEHSNEFFLMQEVISEEVKKVYQDCGQDMAKTMQALSTDTYRKTMLEHVKPRGVITLIAGDGSDPVTFSQNTGGLHADWGYTSRSHGYQEEKAAPAVESRKDRLKRMQAEAAGTAQPAKPTVDLPHVKEEKTPSTSVPGVPPKTDTAIPASATEQFVTCPTNYSGKHARGWHEKHFGKGSIPKTEDLYKPRPVSSCVPASHFTKLSSMKEIPKDLVKPATSQGIAQYPAMVPPNMKKTMMDRLKAHQVDKVLPEKLPDLEKEFPKYSEQIDEPVEELVLWSNKELRNLSNQELFCYANEMRHRLIAAVPSLLQKKEVVAEVVIAPLSRKERLRQMQAG